MASQLQADGVLERSTVRLALLSREVAEKLDDKEMCDIGSAGFQKLKARSNRFNNYWRELFGKQKEICRNTLGRKEIDKLDVSLASYLKLLSGYLQAPGAIDTVEYLIRVYKIHIHNWEDLVLCFMPYHHMESFGQILKLFPEAYKSSKWGFLDSTSPPRCVIVQQCSQDMDVLKTLSDYAIPAKNKNISMPVVIFFTSVVFGVLTSEDKGIGDNLVNQIQPFIDYGIQSGVEGCLAHKAGAFMLLGMVATRVKLDSVHFMKCITNNAFADMKPRTEKLGKAFHVFHGIRLPFMTLILFVQEQSVDSIPKKVLLLLMGISNTIGVLLSLSQEFNITKFMAVLLRSFLHHSQSEHKFGEFLAHMLSVVRVEKDTIAELISLVFSQSMIQTGEWARTFLLATKEKYPDVLVASVSQFLNGTVAFSREEESKLFVLNHMMDFMGFGNITRADIFTTQVVAALLPSKASSYEVNTNELKLDEYIVEALGRMCDELFHKAFGDDASLAMAFGILEDLVLKMDASSAVRCAKKISDICSVPRLKTGHIGRSVKKATESLEKRLTETE